MSLLCPYPDGWEWWEDEAPRPTGGTSDYSGRSVMPRRLAYPSQRRTGADYRADGARLMAQERVTPLEFLEQVMSGERLPTMHQMDSAKAIMPYRHKKLPVAIETSGPDGAAIPTSLTIRFVKPDAA